MNIIKKGCRSLCAHLYIILLHPFVNFCMKLVKELESFMMLLYTLLLNGMYCWLINIQLSATDLLALASMKNAAKCDK
jgi:hypothetical protein